MKKRDLFTEMMQGVTEMAAHREGKITLRQYAVDVPGPQHGAYAGEGRGIDTVAVASGVLGIQRIERPALKRIRGRIGLQQPSQGVVKRRLPHPQCGEGVRTSPWRQFDVLVEQVERTGLKIGH